MASTQKTTLNRSWLMKMAAIFVVVMAFGSWGLYDASVVFPNRGKAVASYLQLEYLRTAEKAGLLMRSAVENPVEELTRLGERETLARLRQTAADSTALGHAQAAVELARYRWLDALKAVGMLDPENTRLDNPARMLDELAAFWGQKGSPKELNAWDIPVQWLIVVVCYGVGLWMVVLFLGAARKSYQWEPDEQRLTLPGGATLVPADIEEFDKRKWHKFLVFLKIKPNHRSLGGKVLKLDLLRYSGLEGWVLEMERAAFPENAELGEDLGTSSASSESDNASGYDPNGDNAEDPTSPA
jgi:hypothetical protein